MVFSREHRFFDKPLTQWQDATAIDVVLLDINASAETIHLQLHMHLRGSSDKIEAGFKPVDSRTVHLPFLVGDVRGRYAFHPHYAIRVTHFLHFECLTRKICVNILMTTFTNMGCLISRRMAAASQGLPFEVMNGRITTINDGKFVLNHAFISMCWCEISRSRSNVSALTRLLTLRLTLHGAPDTTIGCHPRKPCQPGMHLLEFKEDALS